MLASAERLVAESGPDALSVRVVAEDTGNTTWAVYSLFGSKEALVAALARRAFELLGARLDEVPESDDPAADLIDVGVKIFRRFVREHPSLFRIAFQRIVPGLQADPGLIETRERVFLGLLAKVKRLEDAGLLAGKSVREAATEFNAMCEGLGNAELRGATLPILPVGKEERAWRDALGTVVRGFSRAPTRARARSRGTSARPRSGSPRPETGSRTR